MIIKCKKCGNTSSFLMKYSKTWFENHYLYKTVKRSIKCKNCSHFGLLNSIIFLNKDKDNFYDSYVETGKINIGASARAGARNNKLLLNSGWYGYEKKV